MTAKEYLEQIKKIDTMIDNKIIEQRQWLDIALNTTTSFGEKVQSTPNGQKMANAMDNHIDIGREIDRCIDELCEKKQEVIKTIEQLCEAEYDVLHKIYVQYLTFDEVAEARKMSRRWVDSTHGHALLNLEVLLNDKDV